MSIIILLFWILCGVCDAFQSLHYLMTPKERMEIFGMNEAPVYEVIPITISKLQKRSAGFTNRRSFSMRAFNEDITLSCVENDGILVGKNTPIYTVKNTNNNLNIKKIRKTVGTMSFYENTTAAATFTVCKLKNRQQITGVIRSRNLAIRSLPEHIVDKVIKHQKSSGNISNIELNDDQYYLAIKIHESPNVMYNYRARLKRDQVDLPRIIYPEILVIVNYWLHTKLEKWLILYVLSFWHAVDLMYRNLVEPEIKVNIAGIVIARDKYSLEYIYSEEIKEVNNFWGIDTYSSLRGMAKWLYKYRMNISKESYDAAFTMTSNKLYGKDENDLLNGLAYPAGACKIHMRSKMMGKAAIIYNNGAFDRIVSAAHELGHLLGAEHDEDVKCFQGTLMMTEFGKDRNSSDWSECTLQAFDEYIRSDSASCLRNKPNPGKILPTKLPGLTMNADRQCKKLGFIKSCFSKKMCIRLSCVLKFNKKLSCKRTRTAAATGTPCSEGKICFQMQCKNREDLKALGIFV